MGQRRGRRRGSILPLVAVCAVGLIGFTALAIDVGMLMVARTECQLAADAAAMAGARTLNGEVSINNNYDQAIPNALLAATSCSVLSKPIMESQVACEVGFYTYNRTTQQFGMILPSSGGTIPPNENWSLVRAQVSATSPSAFARIFGVNLLQASAVATAVHRPRDVCIILDFSGSMSFDSLLGAPHSGTRVQSLNPDPVVPIFGHYSGYNSQATSVYIWGSGEVLALSNTVYETNAGRPIVNDFFKNAYGAPAQLAFSPASDAFAITPGGDVPLRRNNNNPLQPYATNLVEVLGSTSRNATWESEGYSAAFLNGGVTKPFFGYTQGPRYWGKTFFIWPPDPRPQNDWRRKFFFKADGITPLDDNSAMWVTGGTPTVKPPRTSSATNFYINYAAIMRWILQEPNPFPSQLRAGRIVYYTAFPNVSNPANDAAFNSRMMQVDPTDLNERFWKHYIDFVLGFQQTSTSGGGPVYNVITPNVGYGDDFAWGTLRINAKPTGTDTRYMNYQDNPRRPRLRFWFGPMTMVDFIDNYNQGRRWMPGTAHQAPLWGLKIGMRAAITDILKNHPNDYVALTYFSTPQYSAGGNGQFNRVRAPLGRNYSRMIDTLFYPPITIDDPSTYPEIRPYQTSFINEAPRANGGTCPVMGLMHAYNQFSANPSLRTFAPAPAPQGEVGGLGRVGAQKIVVLMTDGVANTPAHADLVNLGPHQSYYKVRFPGEYPSNSTGTYGSVAAQIYGVANQLCALETANPPGYSTNRKPVIIHCIAFGQLFDPAVAPGASAARNDALTILQTLQYIGKTQTSASQPLPSYKIIIGSTEERVTRLQQCFQRIMQDNVSVTLIE
jgi:hypothetical protein